MYFFLIKKNQIINFFPVYNLFMYPLAAAEVPPEVQVPPVRNQIL